MIEAQMLMDTPLLIALMIMAALVGYLMDYSIVLLSKFLSPWRFLDE